MQSLSLEELSALHGPRYRWYAIVATMLGTVSMVLSTTIVNVALPEIMQKFQVGHDTVQWMSTGFLAATSATMLATAWLVNTLGQRNTFLFSLALFMFASLLGGASPNVDLAILARVLQGAAAGLIQPLAMITIFQVFPAEARGSAMGLYGVGVVLAPAIGPALGGVLVEDFGWRSTFLVGLPFLPRGHPHGQEVSPWVRPYAIQEQVRLVRPSPDCGLSAQLPQSFGARPPFRLDFLADRKLRLCGPGYTARFYRLAAPSRTSAAQAFHVQRGWFRSGLLCRVRLWVGAFRHDLSHPAVRADRRRILSVTIGFAASSAGRRPGHFNRGARPAD